MRLQEWAVPAQLKRCSLLSSRRRNSSTCNPARCRRVRRWNLDRSQLGFQQPQGLIRLNPVHDRDLPVMHQHRWRRQTLHLAQGNYAEGDREIEAVEQLTDVVQVEMRLLLQTRINLVAQSIAVERHIEMVGEGLANGHRHGAGTTGPRQAQGLELNGGLTGSPRSGRELVHLHLHGLVVGVGEPDQALLGW